MKKVLITGGTGFLADKIFQATSNTYHPLLGSRNLEKLRNTGRYASDALRYFDVQEPVTFPNALEGVESVVHLAAMDFQSSEKDPSLAWKVNRDRVADLLKASVQSEVKNFLYFSTIHVYGSRLEGLITEETRVAPENTYAETHLAAEELVLGQKAMNGTVIRLSNSIGLPLYSDASVWVLVVNDLCKQAVKQRKMTLNSSGLQRRDFVPSSDVGRAVSFLLGHPQGGIYNFGLGKSLAIVDMAVLIQRSCEKVLGFKPDLETRPSQNEIIREFEYSIRKLKGLGFQHSFSLEFEVENILRSLSKEGNKFDVSSPKI